MTKLKRADVGVVRAKLLSQQGMRCALCNLELVPEEAVLDHDHATGAIRATLHRGCNSLLGRVENGWKRYGVKSLLAFTAGIGDYIELHRVDQHNLVHPTHFTKEEKAAKAKAKRQKAKAKAGSPPAKKPKTSSPA